MDGFMLHHLRVETVAETMLLLNEYKGSAIRGALFNALRGPMRAARDGYAGFCVNKVAPSCWECPLHQGCPVSTLVATLDTSQRGHGRYAPRPYIIRAPLDGGKLVYEKGEFFTFDLALCADALMLFPYVVLSLERLLHEGLGKRVEQNGWQRGRLRIRRIETIHPLSGERQEVRSEGSFTVQMPDLPVTHADVLANVADLPASGRLTLEFHTPMRLINRKRLLKVPDFRVLFHRLITRLEELSGRFSDTPLMLDVPPLLDLADKVQLVENETRWIDLRSYSQRRRRDTQIGGLVGKAIYEAEDWQPFLPWLLWGSLLGVGKNTVKGEGWYSILGG